MVMTSECSQNENEVYNTTLISNGTSTEQQPKSDKEKKTIWSQYTYRQWSIFLTFCAICSCAGMCYSIQAPFYPRLAEEKGVPATVHGMVFGVFELVNFVACPIYGQNIGRFGAKRLLHGGSIVMATCCILFGFLDKAPAGPIFISLSFIIRIIEALGQSAYITSVYATVAQEFSDNVATTFSILETVYGVGIVIGPAAGGVIFELGGYVAPFAVIGIILLLLSIGTFFLFPVIEQAKGRPGSLIKLLKIPSIAICYYAVVAVSFSFGFTQALLAPHIKQFGLSSSIAGLVFIVNGGTYALSAVGWGYAADKGVNPKLLCGHGGCLIILSFIFIGPFPLIPIRTELWLLIVALAVHGVGGGGEYVSAFIDSSREALANGFPDNIETYGIISGLWVSGLALGCFLGPSLSGILYDCIGFGYTATVVAALHVVVVCLSYGSYYYSKKQEDKFIEEVKNNPEKSIMLQNLESATSQTQCI